MFLSFEAWGTCYQIFGTTISIDWILRTVFSQLSRKLDRVEDSLHVQASTSLSWMYRMPSARSGLASRQEHCLVGIPTSAKYWTHFTYRVRIDGPCRDCLTVRLAIAPGLGTNSLKIWRPAPILLKESATPKSAQTQGPIYLKKSSQNRYIGAWVWQKIKIHILVPRFAQFKVARR